MLCQQLTEARARPNCLDGGAIAEPGALAIDDTRDVYVRVHAKFLSSFDHLVVRADSLVRVSIGVLDDNYWTDEHTVSIGGKRDFAPFCIS
jgi:hypothetical protein